MVGRQAVEKTGSQAGAKATGHQILQNQSTDASMMACSSPRRQRTPGRYHQRVKAGDQWSPSAKLRHQPVNGRSRHDDGRRRRSGRYPVLFDQIDLRADCVTESLLPGSTTVVRRRFGAAARYFQHQRASIQKVNPRQTTMCRAATAGGVPLPMAAVAASFGRDAHGWDAGESWGVVARHRRPPGGRSRESAGGARPYIKAMIETRAFEAPDEARQQSWCAAPAFSAAARSLPRSAGSPAATPADS